MFYIANESPEKQKRLSTVDQEKFPEQRRTKKAKHRTKDKDAETKEKKEEKEQEDIGKK